jgi:hypothetical protein
MRLTVTAQAEASDLHENPPASGNGAGPTIGIGPVLSAARDLAFVVSILAFFAGFEYIHFYYAYLGIPSATFPIANLQVLADSYSVFAYYKVPILIGVLAIMATLFGIRYVSIRGEPLVRYQGAILLLVVVACFPLTYYGAQETAIYVFREVVKRQTGAPDKPIILMSAKKGWNLPIGAAIKKGCVELITQSADTIYVLVRQKVSPYVYVAAIPTNLVAGWFTPLSVQKGAYTRPCIPNSFLKP